MSDYSDSSVSPRPRHRHHHRRHQIKESYDYSSTPSPLPTPKRQRKIQQFFSIKRPSFLGCILVTVFSFVLQLYLPQPDIRIKKPNQGSQPLAFKLNELFYMIPQINCLANYTDSLYEITLISFTVTSIYFCLQYTGQSPFLSFLVSVLILFDETTYTMMIHNPSFAFQLQRMAAVISLSNEIIMNDKFSIIGMEAIFGCLFNLAVLTYLRIENVPIIFIYIVALSYSNPFRPKSRHFIIQALSLIGKSIFLILAIATTAVFIGLIVYFFEFPHFGLVKRQSYKVVDEFFDESHNFAFILLPLFALLFSFSSKKPPFMLISYFACMVLTFFLPLGSNLDDFKLKVANIQFYSILWFGSALVTPDAGIIRKLVICFTLCLVVFLYLYPLRD